MHKPEKRTRQINPYLDNPPDAVFERSVTLFENGKPVQWRHTFKQSMLDDISFVVNRKLTVFRRLFDPPSFMIFSSYPELQRLLYDLGIPDDPEALYYSWFLRGGDYSNAKGKAHKRAQSFTVEGFGRVVGLGLFPDLERQLSQHSGPRFWSDSAFDDVAVWRTRVYPKPIEDLGICPARPMSPYSPEFPYLESRWDYSRDQEILKMGGFEPYAGCFSNLKEFYKRTANILMRSPVRWGRTPIDPVRFREMAVEIHNRLWIETGEKPNQDRVALEMGLNPHTFKSRWRNTDGNWDTIPLDPTPNPSSSRRLDSA